MIKSIFCSEIELIILVQFKTDLHEEKQLQI